MAVRRKNIYRVGTDSNGTHAWRVIVQRKKKAVQRMFSDGVHGAKAAAVVEDGDAAFGRGG